MTWQPGDPERRRVSPEFEYVKGQLALLNEKLDNLSKYNENGRDEIWRSISEQSKAVAKHTETLYGNGKLGVTTLMNTLCEQFRTHCTWDRWMFGVGITVILAIFGKIVFF